MAVLSTRMVLSLGFLLLLSPCDCSCLIRFNGQSGVARLADRHEVLVVIPATINALDPVMDLRGIAQASVEPCFALPVVISLVVF